eukprot:scaffold12694_cov141-Skeletonema_marinoi.AAC.4
MKPPDKPPPFVYSIWYATFTVDVPTPFQYCGILNTSGRREGGKRDNDAPTDDASALPTGMPTSTSYL